MYSLVDVVLRSRESAPRLKRWRQRVWDMKVRRGRMRVGRVVGGVLDEDDVEEVEGRVVRRRRRSRSLRPRG